MAKKEIKKFLENVIDRVIEEKKENKKLLKIQEAKKIKEDNDKVITIKEGLHNILKNVDWDKMSLSEAKILIKNLKNWADKA